MINVINNLIYRNSACITAFPKSGLTWVCYVLANLLYENKDINPTNINEIIPSINHKLLFSKTKLYKSHLMYGAKNFFKKNVYIIRNPKSVFVSNYY